MSVDPARIDALYDSVLRPRIEALEGLRLGLKRQITKAAIAVGVPFAIFFFRDLFSFFLSEGAAAAVSVLSFAGIFVGIIFAALRYGLPGFTTYANYQGRFKHEVVREVFRLVVPDGTYSPNDGVAEEVFDAPGIFSTTGTYKTDDRVRGKIGQTPFEAAEVRRQYTTGGKKRHTVVVFHGLFFHLDFNKALRAVTIVQPRTSDARFGSRDGLSKVGLESPAFAEAFEVFASDEVEARYILTPAMMERLLSLQQHTGKSVSLGFKGNRAYLGVNYGRQLFEPGIAETTAREAIAEMAEHFALAEFVVHELDLNTRIWTKGVDDSLLRQESDPQPLAEAFETAKSGALTEEALWKAATKAVSATFVESTSPVAAPAATRVRVDHGAGMSTFSFGLPFAFWFAIVVSALCAAVVTAALRAAAPEILGRDSIVTALPEVPVVEPLMRGQPVPLLVALLIVSTLVGGGFMLFWTLRVRRVEVEASAVRISRGLRPFPRTYPRNQYGRVVITGNSVFLAKSEGLAVINVSASPTLTEPEAQWVAYELKQALDRTGAGMGMGPGVLVETRHHS